MVEEIDDLRIWNTQDSMTMKMIIIINIIPFLVVSHITQIFLQLGPSLKKDLTVSRARKHKHRHRSNTDSDMDTEYGICEKMRTWI